VTEHRETGASLEDPIVVRFINAKSDQHLAQFLSRFGFPDDPGMDPYALEDLVRRRQQELTEFAKAAGIGAVAAAVKAANRHLVFHGESFGAGPTRKPMVLHPSLDYPPDGQTPCLRLRVEDLRDFMCMECTMIAEKGARLASCEHCSDFYLTGPFTGRRSHSRYCSDRCRAAAMKKRRGESSQSSK
jgi:hypothetical protein